ncbi:MAG: sialidase family protein [Nitrososphaerales archaeon]
MSNHSGYMVGVHIAATGNNVYAVWSDNSTGKFEIYFDSSYNNGLTWNNVQQLTSYSGPSAEAIQPRVAAIRNFVYIMFLNGSNSYCCNNQLLLLTSSNKGASFNAPYTLASGAYEGGGDIVAYGSNVYVAWDICSGCPSNEEIFFRASANNGTSFGSQLQLSNTPFYSFGPKIAVSGSHVYVAWTDNGNGAASEILYAVSSDNGTSFGSQQSLSNDNSLNFYGVGLVASGNSVYAIYNQLSGFNGAPCPCTLLFTSSSDNGSTFASPTTVATLSVGSLGTTNFNGYSGPALDETNPSLLLTNNGFLASWYDISSTSQASNVQVYLSRSNDNGVTWQQKENLSNDSAFAAYSTITSSGNSTYAIWEDNSTGHLNPYFLNFSPATSTSSTTSATQSQGPTVVQDATGSTPTSYFTSVNVALPNKVTTGDVFVVGCQAGSLGSSNTTISVSDSLSNNFTTNVVATNYVDPTNQSGDWSDAILSAPITQSGTDTVTCSSTVEANMKVQVLELSGVSLSNVITATGNGEGSIMSTSPLSFSPGSFLYAIGNLRIGGCSAGSGFTGALGGDTVAEYATSGIISPTTFDITCANSGVYAEASAIFGATSNSQSSTSVVQSGTSIVQSSSSSNSTNGGGFVLPPALQPYSSLITIALLFVSGLLMGIGVKKALVGAILIIVGLLVASFSGLGLPFLNPTFIVGHLLAIMQSQLKDLGPVFFTFPIFWIVGFAVGIWKG